MFVSFLFLTLSLIAEGPQYLFQYRQTEYGYKGTFELQQGQGPYPPDATHLNFELYCETPNRLHFKIYDPTQLDFKIPDVVQVPEVNKSSTNINYEVELSSDGGILVRRKDSKTVIFDTTSSHVTNPLVFEEKYHQFSTTVSQNPFIYGLGQHRSRYPLRYPMTYLIGTQDWNSLDDGGNHYGSYPFHMEITPDGKAHGILFLTLSPLQINLTERELTYRCMGGALDFYIFLGPTPSAVMDQYTSLVGRPCLVPQWALGIHQCYWGYRYLSNITDTVEGYKTHHIPLDAMWIDIDYMQDYKLFTTDPIRYPQANFSRLLEKLRAEDKIHSVVIVDPGIKLDPELKYAPYAALLQSGLFVKDDDGEPVEGAVWPGATIFPDFTHPNISSYWGPLLSSFLLSTVPVDGLWLDMNELSNFCNGECEGGMAKGWRVAADSKGKPIIEREFYTPQDSPEVKEYLERRDERRRRKKEREVREDSQRKDNAKGAENPSSSSSLSSLLPPVRGYPWLPFAHLQANHIPLLSRTSLGPYLFSKTLFAHLECTTTAGAMKEALGRRREREQSGGGGGGGEEGRKDHPHPSSSSSSSPLPRPFILTRSGFVGTGRVAGVWSGDNRADWADLRASLPSVFSLSLFGLPFCGADVGGFGGGGGGEVVLEGEGEGEGGGNEMDSSSSSSSSSQTTPELFLRWIQLASFLYPFFRSHAALYQPPHPLFALPPVLREEGRRCVEERQKLQSYFYTLVHEAHEKGTPIVRPLSFVYPTDPSSLSCETQALLGAALLCCPALSPGAAAAPLAHFPPGTRWYDYWQGEERFDLEEVAVAVCTAEREAGKGRGRGGGRRGEREEEDEEGEEEEKAKKQLLLSLLQRRKDQREERQRRIEALSRENLTKPNLEEEKNEEKEEERLLSSLSSALSSSSSLSSLLSSLSFSSCSGVSVYLPAPLCSSSSLSSVPLFVRGGAVFTRQRQTGPAIAFMRSSPLTVVAALGVEESGEDEAGMGRKGRGEGKRGGEGEEGGGNGLRRRRRSCVAAEGRVVVDDGETESEARLVVHFTVECGWERGAGEEKEEEGKKEERAEEERRRLTFTSAPVELGYSTEQEVEEIQILGVLFPPHSVSAFPLSSSSHSSSSSISSSSSSSLPISYSYNPSLSLLSFSPAPGSRWLLRQGMKIEVELERGGWTTQHGGEKKNNEKEERGRVEL